MRPIKIGKRFIYLRFHFKEEEVVQVPSFEHPVIGQEAVVPQYGLGRVVGFYDKMPERFIIVEPYVGKNPMNFEPGNVKLVKIFYENIL